ncbi:MAG: SDR family oxidoreductase [Bacillus sp. (in: firmicutes)]
MRTKTAFITGGATGIGKRVAIELAKTNVDIFITYVNSRHKAEQLVKELRESYHIDAYCYKSDASSEDECRQAVEEAVRLFGSINIFIHCAGPYVHEQKRMADYTVDEFQYIINGNLNSFFYLTRQLIPYMRSEGWGRIVTFGFDRSDTAPAWKYRSAFAAAKSGLTSLTKTLAMEEAENGITVNMVSPGDIVPAWKEKDIRQSLNQQDDSTPVGRPGTGEDVARVIAFLCDENSSFLTGSVIPVTGGKDVLSKRNHLAQKAKSIPKLNT